MSIPGAVRVIGVALVWWWIVVFGAGIAFSVVAWWLERRRTRRDQP